MGSTPLHLSLDNPSCLRILVAAASPAQLNRRNYSRFTALHQALRCSWRFCRDAYRQTECSHCSCAESAIILLQADCAVSLEFSFEMLSMRCKMEYIHHMKNRRARLKILAIDNLTSREKARFRLYSQDVLDGHAKQVYDLLRDRGIPVPDALVPQTYASSIYHEINNIHDANLAHQYGFRDIDFSNTAKYYRESSVVSHRREPEYIDWLVNQGVDLFYPLYHAHSISHPPDCLRAAHALAWSMGYELSRIREIEIGLPEKSQTKSFCKATMRSNIIDDSCCKCSPGGCRSSTYMLKALYFYANCQSTHDIAHLFCWWLCFFEATFSLADYPAFIRFLTFEALNIHHTCYDLFKYLYRPSLIPAPIEEVQDPRLLELLEDLLKEFIAELLPSVSGGGGGGEHLEFTQFLHGQWADRMASVLKDGERPPSPDRNPYTAHDIKHWIYELDQIVPED